MVGQSSLVYNSLPRKHQFKATPKLKLYDGESLKLGNFTMNLEAKVPTKVYIFHNSVKIFFCSEGEQ
jgi:hypothetical protein